MEDKKFIKYNEYWKVIADHTGYDFSGYSTESLNKRLEGFISNERIGSVDELKSKLYSDKDVQEKILGRLMISYTEMFRDPDFFYSLRKSVLPFLSTYSKISIWHAGCATGEEAYTLAILLHELNLLKRCEIFATDINDLHLKNAEAAIYPIQRMHEAGTKYFAAGGKNKLSNYYTAYYDHVVMNSFLRDRVTFLNHNLIKELPMKKFHLILCRNVFFYFDKDQQRRVLRIVSNSLHNYGYLGIGLNEHFNDAAGNNLSIIDRSNKIYRKVI